MNVEHDKAINDLRDVCHRANINWWRDLHTGDPIQRNVGELIALCHSELSEALEGHRKGLMDDKLPHRPMIEVELADCLIRIFDMAGGLGLDLGGAFVEKMVYNTQRSDHKREHRVLAGGKKY
jgi:NTP pyrophosphatase (non-canonical NTP hydrolase)